MENEELMSTLPLQIKSIVQTSRNICLQTEEPTEPDSFFFVFFMRASNQRLFIMKFQKLALIWSCNKNVLYVIMETSDKKV